MWLPVIPSTIVNSVECAYPVPADLAVGLLYVGANTLAIGMTFIGQSLLTLPDDAVGPPSTRPFFPYMIWALVTMVVGLLPTLFYNGQYLRLKRDLADSLLSSGEREFFVTE